MSRSFKKVPGFSDGPNGFAKREANRKVRHHPDVGNGGAYKKLFEQWDICDWNFRYYSLNEVIESLNDYGDTYKKDNAKRIPQLIYRHYRK